MNPTFKNHFTIAAILVSSMSFQAIAESAEGGHGAGNGGGGEPLFHALATDIGTWLNLNLQQGSLAQKLDLRTINAESLVRGYQQALAKTHVKFIPAAKLGDECDLNRDALACDLIKTSRTCKNTAVPAVIECNEDLFNAKAGDEQFAIVFHEYLGVAGIEFNDQLNYSQYPVSKNIMKFADPKTVVRWELGLSEKTADKVPARCNISFSKRDAQSILESSKNLLAVKGYTLTGVKTADLVMDFTKVDKPGTYRWTRRKPGQLQELQAMLTHVESKFSIAFENTYNWRSDRALKRESVLQNVKSPDESVAAEALLTELGFSAEGNYLDAVIRRMPTCEAFYNPGKAAH